MPDPPKQHQDDIFRVGDQIPWNDRLATVSDRSIHQDIPDDLPDWMCPSEFTDVERDDDAMYVVLTIELPDDGPRRCLATWLARDLKENFSEHGLPSVRADLKAGAGASGRTRVQTPATGTNPLDRADARLLATFLRQHRDFEPLYALLGGTDSPEDMDALADALDRAAIVREYRDRYD